MSKVWTKLYPKEVPTEINVDEYKNLLGIFDETVKKHGNDPAFKNFDCTLTYNELNQKANQFASYLQNTLKLKKGDRIAIQMPNLLQYPIALFGSLKAGLIIVNVNPLYTAPEMKHQFNDSGATTLVILAQFAHLLDNIIHETPIKNVIITEVGDELTPLKGMLINFIVKKVQKAVPAYSVKHTKWKDAIKAGSSGKHKTPTMTSDDIAFLQYTGGTTGVSKGAILTHKNIIANSLQISNWMKPRLTEGQEVALTPLPLYHIFSLTVCCFGFMKYGACNILVTNPRDMNGFIKTMKKNRFTILTGVNTLYNAITNAPGVKDVDFSHLKISVAGAMALQTSVKQKWKEVTGTSVIEGYGLTETSPVACVNPLDREDRPGSIGIPVPSTDVKLVNDEGKDVTYTGEAGELCVKGPQVMQGYYNRPEETEKVLQDGWLLTGDIATMDPDGYFRIVDRKKNMILVSGFNVYPNEVEDAIAKHPKVKEVAAIGVPDDKSGEVVKIFVVKADDSLTEQEILGFCKESLTNYKRPKFVEFTDDLPKTNVGKILHRVLREKELAKLKNN